jgi:hypothetical protein
MAMGSVNKAMCDSQELTMVLDARAQRPVPISRHEHDSYHT